MKKATLTGVRRGPLAIRDQSGGSCGRVRWPSALTEQIVVEFASLDQG